MTDDDEYLSWVFHYTWQAVCKSPLGRNLAVVGALCAAYETGTHSARCSRCGDRRDVAANRAGFLGVANGAWFPGCGWESST